MSSAPAGHARARDSVNLPFLVAVAIIIGVGLTFAPAWFLTGNWLYFGIFVTMFAVGGYLLFHRGTGADSA
jgi:hypothetical protein